MADKIVSTQKPLVAKFTPISEKIIHLFKTRKKITITICALIILFIGYTIFVPQRTNSASSKAKSVSIKVDKNFEFPALNANGKPTYSKIQMKVVTAEKTNQVVVKDQVYTAKNNKTFLIVNVELKNDATTTQNIFPGDLMRLAIGDNKDSKFAPDLHNNLVPVSAISTKTDRIGFVVPEENKSFTLFIGEIEGKKESVEINFPS